MKTLLLNVQIRVGTFFFIILLSIPITASALYKMESKPAGFVIYSDILFMLNTENVETEPNLKIEDWMMNLDSFLEKPNGEELTLPIEGWMLDVYTFSSDDEPELEVKTWMTNVSAFVSQSVK